MGHWLTNDYIKIGIETRKNLLCGSTGYRDIDDAYIQKIADDPNITRIQISQELPQEAYETIDAILAKRNNLLFRIYGLYGIQQFDISFLRRMPHLQHLSIECHLRSTPDLIDFSVLKELKLKSLSLDAFDLYDYRFLQELDSNIEELTILADGKSVLFDCRWLMQYKNLHTLWLGKKAKKNIESLAEIPSLRSLSLRGISLKSFDFLKQLSLEKLYLLWNSNNELDELKELQSLKEIGLWRINKLENIDFISDLVNLEVIKMQDLKHIKALPDLSKLSHLKTIVLDNTGIHSDTLDETTLQKVEWRWK